jgi:release factor glutamine methyltransferase
MRQTLLRFFGKPIRKGVQWYLSKPREFRFKDITVSVSPGVFHPGFFFSTRFILDFLASQNLDGKKLLDLGCGSGIISIYSQRRGASVTAVDINQKAVRNTIENSIKNEVKISAFVSDLFGSIPQTLFDWIVINPPYYPADPKTEEENAWNCGKNHEYFEKLFTGLGNYITAESKVLMILSEVCDLKTIFEIASSKSFFFEKISQKKVWADGQNYLYFIRQI